MSALALTLVAIKREREHSASWELPRGHRAPRSRAGASNLGLCLEQNRCLPAKLSLPLGNKPGDTFCATERLTLARPGVGAPS